MKLRLTNLTTEVIESTKEERAWLDKYLSFEDATARYRYNKDQRIRLYNRMQQAFPSGAYALVRRGAMREGFSIELDDARKPPVLRDSNADLGWLRPYQLDAIDAAVDETRGIVWAPTGSGKTEIAVGLTRALPCSWLFLVHRKTLVSNTADRYALRTDEPAHVYEPGNDSGWDEARLVEATQPGSLVVATFQTFVAAMKRGDKWAMELLAEAEGLMVDESHTLPADTFYRIAMSTPKAYYRIGLSGTPLARGDRRSVKAVAALGPVIYRIKTETLIKVGALARPKIVMPTVRQTSDKPTYQGIYGELVVRSAKRNQKIVECTKQAAKPCLIFVKQINHGKALQKRLLKEGIYADFVSGKESEKKRQSMKRELESGEKDVLIASVVFQEGVDIPNLESVVMAHGGKSIIATLQRIGRGMRTDGGRKTEFEVWDVFDVGCAMLEKQSKARARAYKRESFTVTVLE